MEREITEPSAGYFHTEKDTLFYDLTRTVNCDYDVLDEELETVYLNDIVWVNVKKTLCKGRVIRIP